MGTKAYLLRIDEKTWEEFLDTIPRSEYTSINKALNEMINIRVKEYNETHVIQQPIKDIVL